MCTPRGLGLGAATCGTLEWGMAALVPALGWQCHSVLRERLMRQTLILACPEERW